MTNVPHSRWCSALKVGICAASTTCLISVDAYADETSSAQSQPPSARVTPVQTSEDPPQPTASSEMAVTGHASADVIGPHYRSPGLAVALSLTPVPVDFGNLYAENIAWGAAYTAAEVALMTPMMWLVGDHMHHGNDANRTWSAEERGWAVGLVTGYVLVKIASGVHAGFAAASFNREHGAAASLYLPSVAAIPGGAVLGMQGAL